MSYVWSFIYLWTLSIVFTHALEGNSSLRLVQMIFRHGDRAPKDLYPNDPNPESVWTDGLGNLTQVGRNQHSAMGRYLRSYYGKLITSDPNEVYIDAALADQCLNSAGFFVASFYASELQKINESSTWQMPPIHSLPVKQDKYLNHNSFCPRAKLKERTFFNSSDVQNYMKENMIILKNMSECSGFDITFEKNPITLWEAVKGERMYGLQIPDCILANWNWLESYTDRLKFWHSDNPVIQRLRIGPYLGRVVENMKKIVLGKPHVKMCFSFSHATNIVAILQAMKLFDNHYPPYGAAIAFELHEGQTGEKTVRLLHFNSTSPDVKMDEPHVNILDGCSEFCPLDYFVEAIKFAIPDNWEEECQLDSPPEPHVVVHINTGVSMWKGLSLNICFIILLNLYLYSDVRNF